MFSYRWVNCEYKQEPLGGNDLSRFVYPLTSASVPVQVQGRHGAVGAGSSRKIQGQIFCHYLATLWVLYSKASQEAQKLSSGLGCNIAQECLMPTNMPCHSLCLSSWLWEQTHSILAEAPKRHLLVWAQACSVFVCVWEERGHKGGLD